MEKQIRIWLFVIFACVIARFSIADNLKVNLEKIKPSSVRYTKYTDLSVFPIPVVSFKRSGLASSAEEMDEIMEKIIYPLINKSSDPISAIIVEFFPNLPGKVGFEIYWSNGAMRGSLIDKSADGHYDREAYKLFFMKPTP
jgi:hypothetical protein